MLSRHQHHELTYSSDDMPTHYSFIVGSSLPSIRKEYERLKAIPPEELQESSSISKPAKPRLTPSLGQNAAKVIAALDERGAWVQAGDLRYHEPGSAKRVIDCSTFIKNVGILAEFLAATE